MSLTKLTIRKTREGALKEFSLNLKNIKPKILETDDQSQKDLEQALSCLGQIDDLKMQDPEKCFALLSQSEKILLSFESDQTEADLFELLAVVYEEFAKLYQKLGKAEGRQESLKKALAYHLQALALEENFVSLFAVILDLQQAAASLSTEDGVQVISYLKSALDYADQAENKAAGAKKELLWLFRQDLTERLADKYLKENQDDQALKLYDSLWKRIFDQARKDPQKTLKQLHPYMIINLFDWGEVYFNLQQGEKFDRYVHFYLDQLLDQFKKSLEPEDLEEYLQELLDYAGFLEKAGELQKAADLLESAQNLLTSILEVMPSVDEISIPYFWMEKAVLSALAPILEKLGNLEEAKERWLEAQTDFNLVCIKDISDRAIKEKIELDLKLAGFYERVKNQRELEELLVEILEEIENYLSFKPENEIEEDLSLFKIECYGLLAKLYEKSGSKKVYRTAEQAVRLFDRQLEQSLNLQKAIDLAWIYELASSLYQKQNDQKRAELYLKKAEALKTSRIYRPDLKQL